MIEAGHDDPDSFNGSMLPLFLISINLLIALITFLIRLILYKNSSVRRCTKMILK